MFVYEFNELTANNSFEDLREGWQHGNRPKMMLFNWSCHFVNWDNPCNLPQCKEFIAFYECISDMC